MRRSILMASLSAVLLSFMVQIIFIPVAFASATYTVLPQISNNRLINGNTVSEGSTLPIELNKSQKVSFVNNGSLVLSGSAIQGGNSNDMVLLLDTADDIVSAGSTANISSNPSDYALFSGNQTGDLTIKGNDITINGNMHSNAGVSFMSGSLNVKGIIETVSPKPATLNTTTYTWGGIQKLNCTNGYTPKDLTFRFGASNQTMPDIDQNLKSQAGNNLIEIQHYNKLLDTYWSNAKNQFVGPSGNPTQVPIKDQPLWLCYGPNPYDSTRNTYTVTGSVPLVLDSNKTYYFDDDVIFSTGVTIKANVKIISTGNILFMGGTLDTTGGNSYIYSVNNNIFCKPSNVSIYNGSFYAPHGDVKFTANSVVINGNIVANNISDIPGSTIINYTTSGSSGNSGTTTTKPTHLDKVKQAAVSFITALQNQTGANKKLGIILYNDHAYPLDSSDGYKLYSLNSDSDYSSLITKVNAIGSSNTTNSNMGDGIRKSINLLSGLSTDLSRNIVTLTAHTPNTYTVDSAGNIYTSLSGDVGTSGVTTKTDYTGGTPLNYAKQWVTNMNTAKVGSSFINCLDDTYTDFLSVGLSTEAVGNAYGSKGQNTSNAFNHYVDASSANLSAILSNSIVQSPSAAVTLPDKITVDAAFTFTLPAVDSSHCFKVKPVLPSNSGYTVTDTAAGTTITKTIVGIVLSKDISGSGKYIIPPTSINIPDITLQYVPVPGKQPPLAGNTYSEQINFGRSSNTLKLTFKDPDLVNVLPVQSDYNPNFTTNVTYAVDVD